MASQSAQTLITIYSMQTNCFPTRSEIRDRQTSGVVAVNYWPNSLLAEYPNTLALTVHTSLHNCHAIGRLILVDHAEACTCQPALAGGSIK